MKVSVHYGLNYPGTYAELQGCWHDADDTAAAHQAAGYEPSILTDRVTGRGTKAEVLDLIRTQLGRCRPGDRFALSLSTHGTQRASRTEPDGYEEAIVCADHELLSDDELQATLRDRAPLVVVTVFADLCFGGGMQRAALEYLRAGGPAPMPRFLHPRDLFDGVELARTLTTDHPTRGIPRAHGIHMTAGAEHEVVWDAFINGRHNGAGTRAWLNTLPFSRTFRQWRDASERSIDQRSTPQHPQLHAGPWQATRAPLR